MTGSLRAEWLKMITTRTFYGLLAGAAAVAAIGAFSTTSATTSPPWDMTTPLHEQTAWVLATINGGMFAIIVGARTFTDEFRHGTMAHTYIADPRRTVSAVSKALVGAASGVLVGVATVAASVVVALLMAAGSGGEVAFHTSDVTASLGLFAAMALWAVVGAGIGAIVRNQVAVVAGALLWVLMLENLGAGMLDEGGRFFPGQAAHALARTTEAVNALAVPRAAVLFVAYGVVSMIAAVLVLRRRDLS